MQGWKYKTYERVVKHLPARMSAALDILLLPTQSTAFGGPFNGQKKRDAVFRAIVGATKFRAVVETGTYRGTTTEHMRAVTGLPVYTVEHFARFRHYAALRFRKDSAVHCEQGDSRTFLRGLLRDPNFPRERVFFYLDAHWADDLPLREEVEIIGREWKDSAILIDDFEVAGDDGYGFDDYGSGKRLCMDYLKLDPQKWQPFWPKARASEETGAKRGYVVLVQRGPVAQSVQALSDFVRP